MEKKLKLDLHSKKNFAFRFKGAKIRFLFDFDRVKTKIDKNWQKYKSTKHSRNCKAVLLLLRRDKSSRWRDVKIIEGFYYLGEKMFNYY